MIRLLTLFMIFTLAITHGSSIAAAICQHRDAGEHRLALQSLDPAVSSASVAEEAAASMDSKKGSPHMGGPLAWAADMLPMASLTAPIRIIERIRQRPADERARATMSVRPLLEPPSA